MNDNQFHDHCSSDDVNGFEQRLREFKPILPRTSWEDMESLMVEDQKVATLQSRSLVWSKLATHAAAALAGIALGVVLMLVWKADGSVEAINNAEVAEQTLDTPAGTKRSEVVKQKMVEDARPPSFSIASRRRLGSFRQGPLLPLDRNIELRDWRNVSYERLSSNIETVAPSPSDVGKPLTAPQLLQQLMNEQLEFSSRPKATTNSG